MAHYATNIPGIRGITKIIVAYLDTNTAINRLIGYLVLLPPPNGLNMPDSTRFLQVPVAAAFDALVMEMYLPAFIPPYAVIAWLLCAFSKAS